MVWKKMKLRSYLAPLAIAPALLWGTPALAQTSCSAVNQYSFAFASVPAATLSYAGTYNYTATRPAGGTVNVQVSFQTFGVASSVVAGRQMPEISTLVSGAPTAQSLVLGAIFTGRTPNIALNNRVVVTTFTFSTPVRELRMFWHDIDFSSNQFRDYYQVLGRRGAATYTATLTSPAGNNNQAGPRTAGGSSLSFGPATTPVTLTIDQAAGTSASGNNANTGNIDVLFDEPVTTAEVRYGNAPFTTGESNTGQQAIGITSLSFCPMPVINVAKSSASFDTTGFRRFNIPDTDVVYTLRVENNGGSTVDANEIDLFDILPSEVTYFNGDFNGASPGTTDFQWVPGTSGLNLTAAGVTYSNNGGSTYAYNPNGGYDPNVDAVQFQPTGTMAANSFFEIRFRARIN